MEAQGRKIVRRYLTEQHRVFFNQLPYFLIGAVDLKGYPQASLLAAKSGFTTSPDPYTLVVNALPLPGEPLADLFASDETANIDANRKLSIAGLGIELHTRRRNRFAGHLTKLDRVGCSFSLAIAQTFGNCPQYIQTRELEFLQHVDESNKRLRKTTEGASKREDPSFLLKNKEARDLITTCDSFFVATACPDEEDPYFCGTVRLNLHRDVSHRGGNPGFVKLDTVESASGEQLVELTWPDFLGNFHFNTLGNLQYNPKAGLLFVDFANRTTLHVWGQATVVWEGEETEAFIGAQRLVKLVVEGVCMLEGRLPLGEARPFDQSMFAPELPLTGDWKQAEAALQLRKAKEEYHTFYVKRLVKEASDILSVYLAPQTPSTPVAMHKAGQFLPIRIPECKLFPDKGVPQAVLSLLCLPPETSPAYVYRTYSLSHIPSGYFYRISVKREEGGLVSSWIHANLREGDVLEAKAPAGSFTLDLAAKAVKEGEPIVLLAAGVGATPLLPMLQQLADEARRQPREAIYVQVSRNKVSVPFRKEVAAACAASPYRLRSFNVYTRPVDGDRDCDFSGRLNAEILAQIVAPHSPESCHFFMCGPPTFLKDTYDLLSSAEEFGLQVPKSHIHYEFFGAGERLEGGEDDSGIPTTEPVKVHFTESSVETLWTPQGNFKSLLEVSLRLCLRRSTRTYANELRAPRLAAG
eukprot:scaffold137_cov398-Prasinococcus_capsulatus_cf.AAC.44